MKQTKLALTIAAVIASSSAIAGSHDKTPSVPTVPDTGIQNTLSGVSGYESSITSSNQSVSVDNAANIGSASAGANIVGGIANSIGISAVGSSASVSTATVTNAPDNNVSNSMSVGSITSDNSAVISNGSVANGIVNTITGGEIVSGINNSVSISSVGSSASLSTRTTMETLEPSNVNNGNTISNTIGGTQGAGVEVSSTNTGDVNNVGMIQGNGITAPNISENSISSSIGISAVGSSASESSATTAAGGISSPVTNYVNASSLSSLNSGNIANVATIDGGSIAGGIGNSVSASAIGSAASMSNTVTIH